MKLKSESLFFFRDVIAWDILSTLMLILQTSPEGLKQLKTVCACMKKIMESFGSIRIGELALQKSEDQGVLLSLSSALWQTMSMDSIGTFIRQA